MTKKLIADADETALDIALTAKLRADADETETYFAGGPFIPPSTIQIHDNKENMVAINFKYKDSDLLVKK